MSQPIIRPARTDEYDEAGRVWMESWVSTGLAEESGFLLANLRARIRREIENGWSLFVADDGGTIAAMLALHLPKLYLDMLFVAGTGTNAKVLCSSRKRSSRRTGLR